MIQLNHQTAPTQFIEANGIRFAYRRFGRTGGAPLVFNQHFRGTMDYWDPAVTDGLAKNREVILFNNAGVSSSSGKVPATMQEMGANAIAFIGALGLAKVDVLGFSIGGMVAQEITAQAPALVRRLILVGTGPRGADMSASRSAEIFAAPTIRRSICGLRFTSRRPPRAGPQASPFWNASFSARIAIPR
jgi:pimeloyl-ACP methyl ester carboxylesterase